MLKKLFSAEGFWQQEGLALIRIIAGALMIFHGWEVFSADKMKGYEQWLSDLHFPAPVFMAYLGKGAEFAGGLLLAMGFLTRLAVLALAITMAVVCFGMGNGKIFTDDQHPFLFILLLLIFSLQDLVNGVLTDITPGRFPGERGVKLQPPRIPYPSLT